MNPHQSTPEEKARCRQRLAQIEAERQDLIAQRQACEQDLLRLDRLQAAGPLSVAATDQVLVERREDGRAIEQIDRHIGSLKSEARSLHCFANYHFAQYFMDAAGGMIPKELFHRIKEEALHEQARIAAWARGGTEQEEQPLFFIARTEAQFEAFCAMHGCRERSHRLLDPQDLLALDRTRLIYRLPGATMEGDAERVRSARRIYVIPITTRQLTNQQPFP